MIRNRTEIHTQLIQEEVTYHKLFSKKLKQPKKQNREKQPSYYMLTSWSIFLGQDLHFYYNDKLHTSTGHKNQLGTLEIRPLEL